MLARTHTHTHAEDNAEILRRVATKDAGSTALKIDAVNTLSAVLHTFQVTEYSPGRSCNSLPTRSVTLTFSGSMKQGRSKRTQVNWLISQRPCAEGMPAE